jgi:two-component system response regulator AtoC
MKRVLVADDDPAIRRLIEATIGDAFELTLVADGAAAIDALTRAPRFDCVILDVTMPGKGGVEVVEEMKAHASFKDVPVVILTAHESAELYRDLMRKGVTVYFYKPFERKKLRQLVFSIVGDEVPRQSDDRPSPARE